VGTINAPSQFEGWLFRIALNAFRNDLERGQAKKREGTHVELDEGTDGDRKQGLVAMARPGEDPVQILLSAERRATVFAAIEALPDQMRRCLQLRVIHELSNQEIALVMGISVSTVKGTLAAGSWNRS
jgi:RNA polymerase sigma-70 factor (ECF subfamily)